MQYRLLLSFIIIIFIYGCDGFGSSKELNKKTILGSWRLYDLENIASKKPQQNTEKLLAEADDKVIVRQGMLLSFFKDGTYTEMQGSGYYRTGKWKYSSKEKIISFFDSGATRGRLQQPQKS